VVIAGVLVFNGLAENVFSPMLMGRGLTSLLRSILLLHLLGLSARGTWGLLAMPLTFFVAVMLSTYPETSWLVSLMVVQEPTSTKDVHAADTGDSTK
jgi:predicted PurR-regulated permease PerM